MSHRSPTALLLSMQGLDLGAIEKKKAEAERDKESAAKFKVDVERVVIGDFRV